MDSRVSVDAVMDEILTWVIRPVTSDSQRLQESDGGDEFKDSLQNYLKSLSYESLARIYDNLQDAKQLDMYSILTIPSLGVLLIGGALVYSGAFLILTIPTALAGLMGCVVFVISIKERTKVCKELNKALKRPLF